MGRIHAHRRGKSHSTRPPFKREASWTTYSQDEIASLIVKMAKDGLTPGVIGVKLRDEYGVPLVKTLFGKSLTKILAENAVAYGVPPDIESLINRAKKLQEHLRVHRADRKNVRSLELLEAKIHRLSKYYKRTGALPQDWKYKAAVAQLA